MAKKAPRRTAERILEAALDLFNRFGEPNVSTTLISSELGISPGNLYYHYPAKDELVNALFDRHEQALAEVLASAEQARDLPQARAFLDALFARIWASRFLYRDLNDLLSRNLRLETRFQLLLEAQSAALRTLLGRLRQAGALQIESEALAPTATALSVVITYWLSYEYVRAPRRALEPEAEHDVCERGALHALQLLAPYVEARQSVPSRSALARASAIETLAH